MRTSAPPPLLRTERLELRRHEVEHAEAIFSAVEENRERLGLFLPWVDLTRTLSDERDYLRMARERWQCAELFDYGVYRREDGAFLGCAGAHTISWQHRRCELGYWIAAAHEGRGYVGEAVGALEAALFDIGFHRLEIRCSSANARSAAVPRRRGYRFEGALLDDVIEKDGGYRSTLVFARFDLDRELSIEAISAEATWALRSRILRPGRPLDECRFPGDEAPGALHFAARLRGETLCVATFHPEAKAGLPVGGSRVYRLRGMATREDWQGRGLGERVLDTGLRRLAGEGLSDLLWCNARERAAGFYLKRGFRVAGPIFDIAGVGPHYVMYRPLSIS